MKLFQTGYIANNEIVLQENEDSVSHLISYIIISGILILLISITTLMTSTVFIEKPRDQLTYYSFVDIANGVSTRITDLYVLIPPKGTDCTIRTDFDLPDDIAGKDYFVEVQAENEDQKIVIYRDSIKVNVSLGGIGLTKEIGGSTTGSGVNQILYDARRE